MSAKRIKRDKLNKFYLQEWNEISVRLKRAKHEKLNKNKTKIVLALVPKSLR